MKSMATKKKQFDCVEMMHRGQAAVKKRLEGMTREEKLAYWKRRAEELREEQRQLRKKARVAMPKDYDPTEPVVQAQVEEDGQYDEGLDNLDPAIKAQTYARIMEAAGIWPSYPPS